MQIKYKIECLPEDIQIEGNASAIDPETDLKNEQWIYSQLESGNEWAWCTVKVTAFIDGIELEGTDYLGGCSYLSQEDFERGGYLADMQNSAKSDLLNQINAIKQL